MKLWLVFQRISADGHVDVARTIVMAGAIAAAIATARKVADRRGGSFSAREIDPPWFILDVVAEDEVPPAPAPKGRKRRGNGNGGMR